MPKFIITSIIITRNNGNVYELQKLLKEKSFDVHIRDLEHSNNSIIEIESYDHLNKCDFYKNNSYKMKSKPYWRQKERW